MTTGNPRRILYAVLLVAAVALVVLVVALLLPGWEHGLSPEAAPYGDLYEPFDWSQVGLAPAPGSAAETVDRFLELAIDEHWEDVHALLAPSVAQQVGTSSLATQLGPMLARAEHRVVLSEQQLDGGQAQVEFAVGDSDGALVLVAEVLNVDGSWYIGQRITLVDEEQWLSSEAGWSQYDSEHFSVVYNGAEARAVETAEALEQAYPDLCGAFGLQPEGARVEPPNSASTYSTPTHGRTARPRTTTPACSATSSCTTWSRRLQVPRFQPG